MSNADSPPIWSPRRRRTFHAVAAFVTAAAACVFVVAGVAEFLARGVTDGALVSTAACVLFVTGAVAAGREARRKEPAAD